MSTISSLASSIIRSAETQVPGIAASSSTSQGSTAASAQPGTVVSLGNGSASTPTYNSLGKLSSTQVTRLEQAITAQVDNTVTQMFSGLQTGTTSTTPTSSLYSILSGSPASSNTSSTSSLLSMLSNTAGTSAASTTSSAQAALQSAILAAQGKVGG